MGFVACRGCGDFGGHVVDLGSGLGVPALILAAAYPDTRWTLIERRTGRVELLRRAVSRLGWTDRIEVIGDDAASVARGPLRGTAQWVTARAFGPPSTTAELGAPFLTAGGSLLTSEPRGARIEDRWPHDGLAAVGLVRVEHWETADGAFVRLERTGAEIPALPRAGARKRPLF